MQDTTQTATTPANTARRRRDVLATARWSAIARVARRSPYAHGLLHVPS